MSKLELSDSFDKIMIKLSEGNPGALNVLFEIMKENNNDLLKSIPIFIMIDSMELYGSYLYMLWNDCCNKDIHKTIKVIDLYKRGEIGQPTLNERIRNVGRGKSFDDLLKESDK